MEQPLSSPHAVPGNGAAHHTAKYGNSPVTDSVGGDPEEVLRGAVCAFDDRLSFPAEVHTVDALVSAMERRQWLSNDEGDALHRVLRTTLVRLPGTDRLRGPDRSNTVPRLVRKRPGCVEFLVEELAAPDIDVSAVLDNLTDALTTPAGVRTDHQELRGALAVLAGHSELPPRPVEGTQAQSAEPRPVPPDNRRIDHNIEKDIDQHDDELDRTDEPDSPPWVPATVLLAPPQRASLSQADCVKQYGLQLSRCIDAARSRCGGPAEPGFTAAGWALWTLLDAVRDGAWSAEGEVTRLRGFLFSRLGLTPPYRHASATSARPALDADVTAAVDEAVTRALSTLADQLFSLQEGEYQRAGDLLVDALAAISLDTMRDSDTAFLEASLARLRDATHIATTADGHEDANVPAATDHADPIEAAQSVIDGLATRIQHATGPAGLTELVAEAFAEVVELFDISVDIEQLRSALHFRWPDEPDQPSHRHENPT